MQPARRISKVCKSHFVAPKWETCRSGIGRKVDNQLVAQTAKQVIDHLPDLMAFVGVYVPIASGLSALMGGLLLSRVYAARIEHIDLERRKANLNAAKSQLTKSIYLERDGLLSKVRPRLVRTNLGEILSTDPGRIKAFSDWESDDIPDEIVRIVFNEVDGLLPHAAQAVQGYFARDASANASLEVMRAAGIEIDEGFESLYVELAKMAVRDRDQKRAQISRGLSPASSIAEAILGSTRTQNNFFASLDQSHFRIAPMDGGWGLYQKFGELKKAEEGIGLQLREIYSKQQAITKDPILGKIFRILLLLSVILTFAPLSVYFAGELIGPIWLQVEVLLTTVCAFVVCLAFWFISSAIRSFYANQSDAESQAEHERQ
jgi:hypothetical protein